MGSSTLNASDASGLIERYKLECENEVTASWAKETFGTILGYSLPGSRRAAMEKYEKEASHAYKTGHYEVALDRFCHYFAIVDTDPSITVVSEMRATLTCNIGACLHQMGHVESAVDYYERAIQEFKAIPFSLLTALNPTRLVYGNLITKRVEYVEKKLAAIRAGEAPDPASYQDGFGKVRKWSAAEMEGKNAWSWLDPRTWFGYGRLQQVGVDGAEQPSSAANAA